ncbi:dihydrofolate reductase family protein [Pseudooceanicola sp. 200-1SW]|uniref:dihydrofolate reductase family protein n=1 Tax=Pseudooceanicola sp. 200-1SW TaxID=3425949 RepID=UPI003D7FA78B
MTPPHIICHMITSLDGRLATERWPVSEETLLEIYDQAAAEIAADGWIVGRATMAEFMQTGAPGISETPRPRPDQPGRAAGRRLGICFDRLGRLRPEGEDLEGDHLVLVLSEQVSDAHVAYLTGMGISVFFSGPEGDALGPALARIGAAFGVHRLLLEGGGQLNGAFLAAGLIDETSTLIYPVVDGQGGVPAIYDHGGATTAGALELISTQTRDHGVVWLRHRLARG